MANINAGNLISAVQEETQLLIAVLKRSGSQRFGKTLMTGLAVAAACYLVNSWCARLDEGAQMHLDAARAAHRYADDYKNLRERLMSVDAFLPTAEARRQQWATNVIISTLHETSLTPESMQPPTEERQNGYVSQDISVVMQAKFQDLVAWLNRLGRTKRFIQVTSLDVQKDQARIGYARIACSVGTMINEGGAEP